MSCFDVNVINASEDSAKKAAPPAVQKLVSSSSSSSRSSPSGPSPENAWTEASSVKPVSCRTLLRQSAAEERACSDQYSISTFLKMLGGEDLF